MEDFDFDSLLDSTPTEPVESGEGLTINFKKYIKPKIKLNVKYGERHLWEMFHKHHYLNAKLVGGAQVFTIYWDDVLVGFDSYIPSPGQVPNAWREHRLVILPEFQGLGFGGIIPEIISQYQMDSLERYVYSVTTHPKLGYYRNNSDKWKANSSSGKPGTVSDYGGKKLPNQIRLGIITYSHVYKGPGKDYTLHHDPLMIWDKKTRKARAAASEISKIKIKSRRMLKEIPIDEW